MSEYFWIFVNNFLAVFEEKLEYLNILFFKYHYLYLKFIKYHTRFEITVWICITRLVK